VPLPSPTEKPEMKWCPHSREHSVGAMILNPQYLKASGFGRRPLVHLIFTL
jgi:hypothetical protein